LKGSKALYRILRGYGVRYLFGMDSPESLYQEIDRDVIRPLTVRDERSGAHMADGYARVSFRPGVCTAIHGPGVTNLVSGLAEAYASCVPVVGIVSAVNSELIGKNSIQEIDQVSVLKPITKWVTCVDDPDRVPDLARKAFRVATTGKPGPVVLNLTYNALEKETDAQIFVEPEYASVPAIRVNPDPKRVAEAADLLTKAERPCLVAGGGVIQSSAWDELTSLAELLVAPVATTMMGKAAIPDNHYLCVGVMGTYTSGTTGRGRVANKIVQESDVVLLVGTKTDQVDTMDWSLPRAESKIIQVDIDPDEIGRNFRTVVGIVGDAKLALQQLTRVIEEKKEGSLKEPPRLSEIDRLLKEWRDAVAPGTNSEDVPINPQRVMKELRDFVDSNTIVGTDASYSSLWVLSHIDFPLSGRCFVSPRGLAGIGSGFPMALGAKLAAPDKRVICVVGDGAFAYSYHELETAARYEIPVITIVLNNKCLAFQKHYEQVFYGKSVECDFLDVNYGKVATELKCYGTRVERPSEIKDALKAAIDSGQPSVIDVMVDPNIPGPISYFDKLR